MEATSNDDVNRAERYNVALTELCAEGDEDAARLPDEDAIGTNGLFRQAVLNAAMQRDDFVAERIARRITASTLLGIDMPGLVKRIRLRVIMNRLD